MNKSLRLIYAFLIGFWVLTTAEPPLAAEQVVVERTGGAATKWWFYTGLSTEALTGKLAEHQARLVDIDVESTSPLRVAATMVSNTGAYRAASWWYVGLTDAEVNQKIAEHNARLIDIDPVVVNGKLLFSVVMVANTGEAQATWWWSFGHSMQSLNQLATEKRARIVDLEFYSVGGQTYLAGILVDNSGDARSDWWWYVGLSEDELKQKIFEHKARLLDIEPYDTTHGKRFAAVLIPSADESRWWWYHGLSEQKLQATARRLGARIVDIEADRTGTYAAIFSDNGMRRAGDCGNGLNSFDREIIRTMKRYQIPGAAAAVVKNGRLVYACAFGYADVDTGEPTRPDSIFRLGSISKPLTVAALKKLEADGRLGMGDLMLRQLGNQRPPAPYKDRRLASITLQQVIDHKGGWDTDKLGFDPMFRSNQIAKALRRARPASCPMVMQFMFQKTMLGFSPGTDSVYSNFGYCVLGRVIEAQSGMGYEAFVKNYVLAPADANKTMRIGRSLRSQRVPGEVQYYDIPFGADVLAVVPGGPAEVQRPDGGFNLEAMDSHGGWISSVLDLARFATFANPQPWPGSWNYEGSLPGTRTRVEHIAEKNVVVALLFNTRPVDNLDRIIDRALRRVLYWPSPDLWSKYGYPGVATNTAQPAGPVDANVGVNVEFDGLMPLTIPASP